jgi:tetrahydromethanopterin S-methyltransferase subunit G
MQRNTFDISSIASPNSRYQKIGKVHCFFIDSEGIPRVTLGPHCKFHLGPAFACSVALLLIVFLVFVVDVSRKVSKINLIVGVFVFFAEFFFYLVCALSNPGMVVPTLQMKSVSDFNYALDKICSDCNLVKEDYTEHCKKCRVCVEEYDDHYCLLGKCVGRRTIKYFYGLIISTFILLIYSITTLFFRLKIAYS